MGKPKRTIGSLTSETNSSHILGLAAVKVSSGASSDSNLLATIAQIRERSENSFLEIENALEGYHLTISDLRLPHLDV